MLDPRAQASAFGLSVELTDLGAASAAVISEYDAAARAIRVNQRALDRYRRACRASGGCDVRAFIDLAVAHELYHHREAVGDIARLAARAQRERAADAFARSQVPVDARLDAFLRGGDPQSGA